jgi:hypothetical protein
MSELELNILNYLNDENNKKFLQDIIENDIEYLPIFVNMEVLGNLLGFDIYETENIERINFAMRIIKNNI